MPRLFLRQLFLLASLSFCLLSSTFAETLKIISNPPGATVELNGVVAGTTPFEKAFPGGYFHRTHTKWGQRLEHPMIARVSLTGYATHEITLTEGPMEWVDIHGHHLGQFWIFKTPKFHVDLDAIGTTFTGTVASNISSAAQPANVQVELSLEEIVRRTKPAVVYIKGLDRSGSGFFVTDTGVLATNDADLDIALAKVEAPTADFVFPHPSLADAASVEQGESV